MTGGAEGAEEIKLLERSLLNWSNPERSTVGGAAYLWTLDGRPQAVICLYPQKPNEKEIACECQSLSARPLSMTFDGDLVWQPTAAGMAFQSLETTPDQEVKAGPSARLVQMRRLARMFSSEVVPNRGNPLPLRLLPSPIYRYPPSALGGEIVDGAIFSFVQGTDPELLLVFEAVSVDGQMRWRYGVARMSSWPMRLSNGDKVVLEHDWAQRARDLPFHVIKSLPL
jgi:hypothetical protein